MTRPNLFGAFAVFFLLASAIAQLLGNAGDWPRAEGTLQWLVVAGQVGLIVGGLAGGVAVLLRRRWAEAAAWAWTASTVLAGTLAPVAYGGQSWSTASIGGAVCLLLGTIIVWLTRRALLGPVAREPRI